MNKTNAYSKYIRHKTASKFQIVKKKRYCQNKPNGEASERRPSLPVLLI